MSSDAEDEGLDLFQEPADYYQPEKQATFASHKLLSGKDLTVRLVGHNPLWVRPHSCSNGFKHSKELLSMLGVKKWFFWMFSPNLPVHTTHFLAAPPF